jgi:hypothetical protein
MTREFACVVIIVVNPACAYNGVVVLHNGLLPHIVKLCVTFLSGYT